jgi:prolyl oligopeptidase
MAFVPALNDRNAPPHDPLKMVARLQAEATHGGPYLLLPLGTRDTAAAPR